MKRFIFLFLGSFPALLLSMPSGNHESLELAYPSQNHMQVKTSESHTIIHWNDFSIGHHEHVQFIQPSSHSAVLNRVLDGNVSQIWGALHANGKVFLINPKGIIIGKNATIDTQSFIASTFDVHDRDFLENKTMRFIGDSKAAVINYGKINAWDGDVVLIGRYVENHGTIQAHKGMAALLAGKEILLHPQGDERIFICPQSEYETQDDERPGILNTGHIASLKTRLLADGNPYKFAIKHEGKIDALAVHEKDGELYLRAEGGIVEVSGELKAANGTVRVLGDKVSLLDFASVDVSGETSAGEVLIGGSFQGKDPSILNSTYTYVGEKATIRANARRGGQGGRAIIWSDGVTEYYGTTEVNSGGFVEVSGGTLDFAGDVLGAAELLLDPSTINVTTITSGMSAGPNYTNVAASGSILNTTVSGLLNAGTNVTITTNPAFGTPETINVLQPVIWGAATAGDLSFITNGALNVFERVECQSTTSGQGNISATLGGDLVLKGTGSNATISSSNGNISLNVGGDLIMTGGAGFIAHIGANQATSVNSNIDISVGGNLSMTSGSGGSGTAQIGHSFFKANPPAMTFTGDIKISSVGGDLTMTASSASDNAYCQIGHSSAPVTNTNPVTISGNISVTNVSGVVKMTAGPGTTGPYALIGHGGITNANGDSFQGDITVQSKGDISIAGGAEGKPQKFAGIGFGQELLKTDTNKITSNLISVQSDSNITLLPGLASNHAFIGANTGDSTAGATCTIGTTRVTAGGNLNLKGSSSSSTTADAVVGIAGSSGPSQTNIEVTVGDTLNITGGSPPSGQSNAQILNGIGVPAGTGSILVNVNGGDAILTGGAGSGGQAFVSSTGTLDFNVSNGNLNLISNDIAFISAQGTSNIFASNDVSLTGDGATDDAFIVATAPLNVEAGNNVTLQNNSSITNFNGRLQVIAGVDINMGNQSAITNFTSNDINLVVDNLFPSSPDIGPGALIMATGATVSNPGGLLRIFTAQQSLNSIQGILNGVSFSPGPLFVDQPPERWSTYYFSSFFYSGSLFTIFYKDGPPVQQVVNIPAQVINRAGVVVSEMLTDLHPYDEYLGWFLRFQTAYDISGYQQESSDGISSFQVIPDQLYYLRMKKHFDQNPKLNHIITFPKKIETEFEPKQAKLGHNEATDL